MCGGGQFIKKKEVANKILTSKWGKSTSRKKWIMMLLTPAWKYTGKVKLVMEISSWNGITRGMGCYLMDTESWVDDSFSTSTHVKQKISLIRWVLKYNEITIKKKKEGKLKWIVL